MYQYFVKSCWKEIRHLKYNNQWVSVMTLILNGNSICTRNQQLCCILGFPCARTEFMMLEKMKRTSIKGSKFNPKTIFWAHAGEFQCQWQKEYWVYATKILSGLPILWEIIKIRAALEVTTSLKIAWYGFKISKRWAIWFISHKRLALHVTTTLTQKLPNDFLEKLIAYLCNTIHLHQKYHYLLDETLVFFNVPTNTIINVKWPKSVCVKTTGHVHLRTRMLSVVADGRNWHHLLF